MNFFARLATFTDKPDECWEWPGCTVDGYGYVSISKDGTAKRRYAHRVAYEYLVGPVPSGLVLDHLCRNRKCMNPKHLEVVTHRVNLLRGNGPTARNAAKTHCANGHPYDELNTYIYRGGKTPVRMCRVCHADRSKKRQAHMRALARLSSISAI